MVQCKHRGKRSVGAAPPSRNIRMDADHQGNCDREPTAKPAGVSTFGSVPCPDPGIEDACRKTPDPIQGVA